MDDKDFQQGLHDKLNQVKHEDKGDDQLYGTAAKLTDAEWRAWISLIDSYCIKHYFNRTYGFNSNYISIFIIWPRVPNAYITI